MKRKPVVKSKGKSGGVLVALGGLASVLGSLGVLPSETIQEVAKGVITIGAGLGIWGIRDRQEETP